MIIYQYFSNFFSVIGVGACVFLSAHRRRQICWKVCKSLNESLCPFSLLFSFLTQKLITCKMWRRLFFKENTIVNTEPLILKSCFFTLTWVTDYPCCSDTLCPHSYRLLLKWGREQKGKVRLIQRNTANVSLSFIRLLISRTAASVLYLINSYEVVKWTSLCVSLRVSWVYLPLSPPVLLLFLLLLFSLVTGVCEHFENSL